MYLDWIASIIGLGGAYLLGRHQRIGWLCYTVASAINVYLGYHAGFLGMAVGGLCYCILEFKGYWMFHHRPKIKEGKTE